MRDMDIKKQSSQTDQARPVLVQSTKPKPGRWSPKPMKFRVISIVLVALVAFSGLVTYKYVQANRQIKKLQNNPQQIVSNSTQKLETRVGQLAVLPHGQAPTVAIVKNVTKLQSEPFFADAHNGDYLLVYTQAKKAVLYRPSTNQIVEYASTD